MGSVTTYLHPLFFLVFCSIPLALAVLFRVLAIHKVHHFIFKIYSASGELHELFWVWLDYFVLICILQLEWVSKYWFYLLCVVFLCACDLRYVLDSFWSCSHCTCMLNFFFLYVKSYVLSSGVRYRYIVILCSWVIFGGFVREHVNF